MKSTDQLERETEEARTRVAHRLDELRARATPGQLVDQLLDYARASDGGEFVGNLRRQVVANPLPVVLLGTSIAWLAAARSAGSRHTGDLEAARNAACNAATTARESMADTVGNLRDRADDATHAMADAAEAARESAEGALREARGRIEDTAESARAGAADMVESARVGAADIAESANDTLESVRKRASDAYAGAASRVRHAARSVERAAPKLRAGVASAGQSFVDLCREQPIVLAGIGLAIGASIGALLPQTAAENRVAGAASDEVKARARRIAAKATDAAQSVYAETKDAAGSALAPRGDRAMEECGPAELGHS